MIFVCKSCNYETDIKSSWKTHLKSNKHAKNTENEKIILFKCEHCSKTFSRKDNLIRHMTTCKQKNKLPKETHNKHNNNIMRTVENLTESQIVLLETIYKYNQHLETIEKQNKIIEEQNKILKYQNELLIKKQDII